MSATTFGAAMAALGYDGLLLRDSGKDDGLGLFWRREIFGLAGGTDHGNGSARVETETGDVVAAASLSLEAVALPGDIADGIPADGIPAPTGALPHLHGSVYLLDMQEQWHKRAAGGSSMDATYDDVASTLRAVDHRSCALVRLQHRRTGTDLWVCTAHLMTTSRDSPKTNAYPGCVYMCMHIPVKRMPYYADCAGCMHGACMHVACVNM